MMMKVKWNNNNVPNSAKLFTLRFKKNDPEQQGMFNNKKQPYMQYERYFIQVVLADSL